jgi:hypothetical protein
MQKPELGLTVHYVSHGTPVRGDGTQAYTSQCRAAVITETVAPEGASHPAVVSLAVLNPEGMFFSRNVPRRDHDIIGPPPGPNPGGTWHYTEHGPPPPPPPQS